jgi:hypothetical protein
MSSTPKMLTIQETRQSHLPCRNGRDNEFDLDRAPGETSTAEQKARRILTSTSSGAGEVAELKAIE